MQRTEEREDTNDVTDTPVLKDKDPGDPLFLKFPSHERRQYSACKTEYPEDRDLEISLNEKFDSVR